MHILRTTTTETAAGGAAAGRTIGLGGGGPNGDDERQTERTKPLEPRLDSQSFDYAIFRAAGVLRPPFFASARRRRC